MAEPIKIPSINIWRDSGKCDPGPNELQIKYFIDLIPPWERPHLCTDDLLLSIGGQGSGKSLKKGTEVLSWDGRLVKIEDVKIGDLLMGPDSTLRTVLDLGRGREVFYKVTPVKGEPWYCNESHILSLKYSGKNCVETRTNASGSVYTKPARYGGEDIINVSVEEYLTWSKRKQSRYMQYRADSISFPFSGSLELDPYILGAWLGDGDSDKLTLTTMDPELEDSFLSYAKQNNKTWRIELCNGKARRIHIHDSSDILRSLGVQFNKHIPYEYKTASIQERLLLLAGLIDTDGYLGSNCMEITQKNKILAEDIVFVCRGLGLAAYIKEVQKSCTYKGEKKWGTYYKISISGDLSKIPCLLKRKQATPRQQKKNHLVTGFKLERLPEDDYYGVVLDRDHLFLLGDFTVTHNTYGAVARIIDQCRRWPNLSVYVGAYDFQVLKRNVWAPFEEILIPNGDKKKGKHEFLRKAFSDPSPVARFANGATVNCINLKNNLKQNIGFTADLLVIDEVHLLPDEDALNLLVGRARGTRGGGMRQVILCTNPEKTKQGWMNHTFNLKIFDGVDTSEHPIEKLVGPKCRCQVCTKCRMGVKKEFEWIKQGEDMICPNCKSTKDFYTWMGKRYWCPGDQQNWRVIKSESTHNPHLPDGYFQGMEKMYDPVLFNIMVKGQLNSDLREDYVYKEYSDQADGNLLDEDMELDYSKPFLWGLDFNLRPQCSSISQIEDIEGQSYLVCKEEIIMYGPTFDCTTGGATVVDVANEFVRRYGKYASQIPVVKIYGDPHGYGNVTSRELTRYQQIINILRASNFQVETIADQKNIPLKERIDNVNHMLRTRKLIINPKCGHVAKSLSELMWKEEATIDTLSVKGDNNARKSNKRTQVYCMTHPTDGLGYLIYKEFNLLKNMEGGRSLNIVGQARVTEDIDGVVTTEDLSKPLVEKVHLTPEMVRDRNEQKNREWREEQERLHAQIQADLDAIMNRSMSDIMGGFGF